MTARLKLVAQGSLLGLVVGADAQTVLYEQLWDGVTAGRPAQAAPGGSTADVYQFDSFTVTGAGWAVQRIIIRGVENAGADPSQSTAFRLRLISAVGDFSSPSFANLTRTPSSDCYRNGDLYFDDLSGTSLVLAPGTYRMTAWVERPLSAGTWQWRGTTPVVSAEHYTQNPGGGLGMGTNIQPGSNYYGAPADLAFSLLADVPEPGTLVSIGIALSLLALLRRK